MRDEGEGEGEGDIIPKKANIVSSDGRSPSIKHSGICMNYNIL